MGDWWRCVCTGRQNVYGWGCSYHYMYLMIEWRCHLECCMSVHVCETVVNAGGEQQVGQPQLSCQHRLHQARLFVLLHGIYISSMTDQFTQYLVTALHNNWNVIKYTHCKWRTVYLCLETQFFIFELLAVSHNFILWICMFWWIISVFMCSKKNNQDVGREKR